MLQRPYPFWVFLIPDQLIINDVSNICTAASLISDQNFKTECWATGKIEEYSKSWLIIRLICTNKVYNVNTWDILMMMWLRSAYMCAMYKCVYTRGWLYMLYTCFGVKERYPHSTHIQFVNVSSHDSTSLSASTTSDISVNQINANIFKSQRKTITGGWDGAGLQWQ